MGLLSMGPTPCCQKYYGLLTDDVIRGRGGGISQKVIFHYEGGGGVSQKVIFHDQGGRGGLGKSDLFSQGGVAS